MNVVWQGSSSTDEDGDWNIPANWVGDQIPGPSDTAEFDTFSGRRTVTISAGHDDVVAAILASSNIGPGYPDTIIQIDGASLSAGDISGEVQIDLADASTFTEPVGGNTTGETDIVFTGNSANVLDLTSVGPSTPDNFAQSTTTSFGGPDVIALGTAYKAGDTVSYVQGPSDKQFGGTLTVSAAGEPIAVLPFLGGYSVGNFALIDDAGQEAIAFQTSVIEVTGSHKTSEGGAGEDTFNVTGSFDQIDGNGGNDTIRTFGSYETLVVGSYMDEETFGSGPDPESLTETITLGGRGNTVTAGDENIALTAIGGFDSINLGEGISTLTIGANTDVTGDGGDYTITATGGQADIRIFDDAFFSRGGPLTIALSGQDNLVSIFEDPHLAPRVLTLSGGAGGSVFDVAGDTADITTGGVYNQFYIGSDSTVTTGSGYALVSISGYGYVAAGENDTVHLGDTHNTVEGQYYDLTVTGGTGSNTFLLDAAPYSGGSLSVDTGGDYNLIVLSNSTDNDVTAGAGYDRVTIDASTALAYSPSSPAPGTSTVRFAGLGNTLSDSGGTLAVSGGDGLGTFTMDGGGGSFVTGGDNNKITVGTGAYDVTTTGSHNIFQLNGPTAAVHIMAGSGNLVFLNAGAAATVDGQSESLRLIVANGSDGLTLDGFAQDAGAFIHLTGGAGGYTTAQQVLAAVQGDGHGGSFLSLGTHGIDFVGVAPTQLRAADFGIG